MSKKERRDFTNKTYNNLITIIAFIFTLGFVGCKLFGILNNSWWLIVVPWILVVFFRAGDDKDDSDEDDSSSNNNLKMA